MKKSRVVTLADLQAAWDDLVARRKTFKDAQRDLDIAQANFDALTQRASQKTAKQFVTLADI